MVSAFDSFFTREEATTGASGKTKLRDYSDDTLHSIGLAGVANMNPSAKHPGIQPRGSKQPDVYCLLGNPTPADDEDGKPFSGIAGRYFRGFFPDNMRERMRFGHVVRTRPRTSGPTHEQIECHRPAVIEDIERTKPKVIIGCGKTVCDFFLHGVTNIWESRGRRFPIRVGNHSCWFYPVEHPVSIYERKDEERNEDPKKMPGKVLAELFRRDLRTAVNDVKKGRTEVPKIPRLKRLDEGIEIVEGKPGDLDRVAAFLAAMAKEKSVTLDTESNCLRPYAKGAKLLCIGIGTHLRAMSIALDHREAKWSPKDRRKLDGMLKLFFQTPVRKKAQNLKHDLEWLFWAWGIPVLRACPWEDTMTQAYHLDERRGTHGLNFLTALHVGIALKESAGVNRAKLDQEPLIKVLKYNGRDVKFTDLVERRQRPILKERGLWETYRQEGVRRIPTLVVAQAIGFPTRQKRVRKFEASYQQDIDATLQAINEDPDVIKYRRRNPTFSPTSPRDLEHYYRDYKKRKEGQRGKKYSVDKAVLKAIADPLAKNVLHLRTVAKAKSTYIDPLDLRQQDIVAFPDGRVHTNFNTNATDTTRLCVAGNTILSTNLGNFEIRALDLRDKNQKYMIQTHERRWQAIKRKWFKGTEGMLRLEFSNGASIECTAGHRVLTPTGWQHAGHLRVGSEAHVDPRFSRAGHPPTIGGVRQEPDHSGVTGESVCRVDTSAGDALHPLGRHDRVNYQVHHLEPLLVSRNLRSGGALCFQQELLPFKNREHAWNSTPENHPAQERVGGPYPSGMEQVATGQALWGGGLHRIPEPQAPRIDHARRSASPLHFYHPQKLVGTGRDFTGTAGTIDGRELPPAAGSNGIRVLEGLRQVVTVSGETERCLPNHEWPHRQEASRWKDVLVSQRRGDADCAATVETESTLRPAMALRPMGSGFYAAEAKADIGGGWHPASEPTSSTQRSGTGQSLRSIGAKSVTGIGSNGKAESKAGSGLGTATVTKITPLGEQEVWDIEVEGDHSYLAQGLYHHNSSEDPNMQNYPKRDPILKTLREMFGPPVDDLYVAPGLTIPGDCVIVSVDYGQIEARVIGMASKDKRLVKALWTDYDIHAEWAERVIKAVPEVYNNRYPDGNFKAFRNEIKNQWVFPAFFGSSLHSIARSLGLLRRNGGVDSRIEPVFRSFWSEFAGVKKWHGEVSEFYANHFYVPKLTGGRRHGPLSWNRIINSGIQGTASDIVVDAMNRLSEFAQATHRPWLHPFLNIHDDIEFFVPKSKLTSALMHIIREMCSVPYSFVNVPIVIEVEVGTNWGKLQEFGKSKDGKRNYSRFASNETPEYWKESVKCGLGNVHLN